MVLLGLSILVASISFLCYRHPPSSWKYLQWFFRPSIQDITKKQNEASQPIPQDEKPPLGKDEKPAEEKKEGIPTITKEEASPSKNAKAELDRKVMPPPPPPFKKPTPQPARSSLATARTPSQPLRDPLIPTFTLRNNDGTEKGEEKEEEEEEPSAPSFPALNSAQRASGGTRGPPRLNAQPNAGLMAPPTRSPLPNRGPPGASSSLAPPPTHTSIPTKPRKKVLLTPGHSPLDWARLSSSPAANLRGLPPDTPYLRVPPSLLKQYTGRKGKDAWTVLGGKVYNMTPYLPYHPGGEPELMKAAGRDGTKLFGEVHPWVNWEGMLENCLVGVAVEEGEVKATGTLDEMD